MIDASLLDRAVEVLASARRIVAFTGAGMSAESGIPTFRDAGGLWQRFPPDQFANWKGLTRLAERDPRHLAEFLEAVVAPLAAAEPNAGHRALTELARHAEVTVVTQNVDGLHQAAGSPIVWEVHGSLVDIVDDDGDTLFVLDRSRLRHLASRLGRLARQSRASASGAFALALRRFYGRKGGRAYRPSIVLFGDAMPELAWSEAVDACGRCDCLLQVGSSTTVYPAAFLPAQARAAGAAVITIDPRPGDGDALWLSGKAGEVLPVLVRRAFGDRGNSA